MSRLLFLPFLAGTMDIIEKIQTAITPSLEAMGYEIVQLRLADHARRKTLSLMAERKDGRMMGFNDCTDISHTVSVLLDVDDPISGAYDLEVCSPGVDRPLVKLVDYTRYKDYEIKLETLVPVGGRKRFKGLLKGTQGEDIQMQTEEGEVSIPFTSIKSAKLIVTDELLRKFLKQQETQSA